MKKILIFLVNPKDTNRLRLDEEVREIQTALKRVNNREQFEIVTAWAIRVEDMRRALLEHQPTIIHFSGHGSGTQGLALENGSGQVQLVSTESLARLFGLFQENIECVLLNACYSEIQAQAIHQYIDYVIGMNQAIGDVAAIEFVIGFYDALFVGCSYEKSFEVGRASIDLQGILECSTPVLKARQRPFQRELHTNPSNTVSVKFPARDRYTGDELKVEQNRSVSIGGNVTGSAVLSGDRNVANVHFQSVSLPLPESVDILAELNGLHEVLATLESPDRRKIENAFADALEEVNKSKPDKDEVGKALNRALDYAYRAEGFVSIVEKLQPHLTKTVSWLGENWHKLLSVVGLTL